MSDLSYSILDIKPILNQIDRFKQEYGYTEDVSILSVVTRLAYTLYRWKDSRYTFTESTVSCVRYLLKRESDDDPITAEDTALAKLIMLQLVPQFKNLVETAVGVLGKEWVLFTREVNFDTGCLLLGCHVRDEFKQVVGL